MGMGIDAEVLSAVFLDLASRSIGFDQGEWEVTGAWVQAGVDGEEVHLRIAKRRDHLLRCPKCGGRAGVYDTRERTWRHLDLWGLRTYVHCMVPRAQCDDCGVHTVPVPWVTRRNNREPFTKPMEAQVLKGAMRSTTKAVAESVGESDAKVWGVINRAVAQARQGADYSGVTKVGLDETAKARGQSHVSTMTGLGGARVVAVADGKDNGVVDDLCDQLEAHGGDRAKITDVTRDMSGPFAKGVRRNMPQAHQTIDKFHVMQLFSKATDEVRNAERKESDEKAELPRGTKYVWPEREENLTERQARIRVELDPKKSHLKTARACQMSEGMRDVYQRATREEAEYALKRLCSWIMHSNVPRMKKVAKTIRENWDDILNWWDSRVTNAILEGTNSLIQSIKRASRGFRNPAYFTSMIFLRHGKLEFEALRG
jgi:transposase